jgi:hypothetical protein
VVSAIGARARCIVVIAGLGLLSACRAPDPAKELSFSGLEAYWVYDTPLGQTQYMAPAVRLVIHNQADRPQRSLEATAVFRRKGEENKTWGSDWRRVAPSGKPLLPGHDTLVVLKSDARYSTTAPEQMFEHEQFRDAYAEVFVRLGSSPWYKVGQLDVERRIGTRAAASAP